MKPVQDFVMGVGASLEGYRYLKEHRSLWRYALAPIVLNIILTIVIFSLLIWVATSYAESIHHNFEGGFWMKVLEVLVGIGLAIAVLLLGVIAWLIFGAIFCSYFYGILARETEVLLGMRRDQMQEISFVYEVVDALKAAAKLSAIMLGCLILSLIPAIGPIVSMALTFYFDSYIFGYDYLDYPLALRGMRRQEKLVFVRTFRAQTLGLGAVVLVFNFIPILGALVLTTSTVGAVLLHRRLSQSGQITAG